MQELLQQRRIAHETAGRAQVLADVLAQLGHVAVRRGADVLPRRFDGAAKVHRSDPGPALARRDGRDSRAGGQVQDAFVWAQSRDPQCLRDCRSPA